MLKLIPWETVQKKKKHNRFKCHISHYFLISYIVTQPNNYEISFTRTIGDLWKEKTIDDHRRCHRSNKVPRCVTMNEHGCNSETYYRG